MWFLENNSRSFFRCKIGDRFKYKAFKSVTNTQCLKWGLFRFGTNNVVVKQKSQTKYHIVYFHDILEVVCLQSVNEVELERLSVLYLAV